MPAAFLGMHPGLAPPTRCHQIFLDSLVLAPVSLIQVFLFLSLYFGFKNGRGGKVSPFLPCRGSLLTCWVKTSDVLPVTPESCLWVFAVVHQQWWPGLETDKSWGWCPFSSISTMPPPRVHLSAGVNCTPGICVTFCAGHQGYRGGPGWTQPCAVKLAAALI